MGYSANADLQDLFDSTPMIRSIDRMTERGGELLLDEVVARTPIAKPPPGVSPTRFMGSRGRAPGTLRGSWRKGDVERTRGPAGQEGRAIDVYTDDPIAPHVEWDTQPHVIRPRPDRAAASVVATGKPRRPGTDPMASLAWIGPGGVTRFAREVHHPGTKGVHMMRDAVAEVQGTWDDRFGRDEVTRWAREQAALVP